MVKSITVFKPPVPVWLGPGASEGAISIVTRDMDGTGKNTKKHTTRVRAAGGSYGLAEGTVSHRASLTSGSAMISVSGKHREGKLENSDRDSGSTSLHWDHESAGKHRVEFDGRYYTSEHGSAGPSDNPTPDARQSYRKFSIDSRLSGVMGVAGDYSFNLYGDTVDLEDKSQFGYTSTLDSVKMGLKGECNWADTADKWAVRANSLLERDDLEHSLSGNHQRVTGGIGIQADRNWRTATATFGARGDHVTDFDVNPGFSGGLRYAMAPRWNLKVNAGYTVRIPTFGQLFQPSHGSIDQVQGNPDLDKEKIYSADATLEFRKDKSHMFQVSLFRTETLDTIVYQRGADLIFQPVNGGRSWRHGLEATWKYTFEAGLTVDANAIVQASEVEDTGNQLTYTPPVKLKLSLQYALKAMGTRLETSLRYCGEQYSEIENREAEKLDDYSTVDVKAVQPFKIKSVAAEWFLTVENVFDADYEVHFGYPDDGVRFVSGLNLTF
jgi:iron complex outermembrane receptor protein